MVNCDFTQTSATPKSRLVDLMCISNNDRIETASSIAKILIPISKQDSFSLFKQKILSVCAMLITYPGGQRFRGG